MGKSLITAGRFRREARAPLKNALFALRFGPTGHIALGGLDRKRGRPECARCVKGEYSCEA